MPLSSDTGSDVQYYQITDHLGSVRVIKDGEGTVLQRFDYYPFGSESRVWTAGTSTPQSALRYRFGGKEIAGQKVSVSTGAPAAAAGSPYLDFGARVYDPRTAAWLSQDPLAEKYYGISPYAYCAGNPVNRIDIGGKWDVQVHLYKDRSEYGYGVAVVLDRRGNEVFRFDVRGEGVRGHNRMKTGADTPLGIYDIPDNHPWITGGSRKAYGPNARLNMQGESGEIIDSGRSEIRIHGGRQELQTPSGGFVPNPNPVLKKTEGCLRAFDSDIVQFKSIVDNLQANDSEEVPGHVFVIDDLKKVRININGNYVEWDDIYQVEEKEEVDWQKALLKLWNYGNNP